MPHAIQFAPYHTLALSIHLVSTKPANVYSIERIFFVIFPILHQIALSYGRTSNTFWKLQLVVVIKKWKLCNNGKVQRGSGTHGKYVSG